MNATHSNIEPAYFDLKAFSQFSSIPVPTLRDYIRVEGLPAYKIRGKVLISRDEFESWLGAYRLNNDLDGVVTDVLNSLASDK
jgi:excisionase family DNA binding protein